MAEEHLLMPFRKFSSSSDPEFSQVFLYKLSLSHSIAQQISLTQKLKQLTLGVVHKLRHTVRGGISDL